MVRLHGPQKKNCRIPQERKKQNYCNGSDRVLTKKCSYAYVPHTFVSTYRWWHMCPEGKQRLPQSIPMQQTSNIHKAYERKEKKIEIFFSPKITSNSIYAERSSIKRMKSEEQKKKIMGTKFASFIYLILFAVFLRFYLTFLDYCRLIDTYTLI